MDAAALKATQAPLKAGYSVDPDTALVTLRADGDLDGSGDMLLEALVACAGVTLRAVATSLGIEATGTVRARATSTSGAPSASTSRPPSASATSGSPPTWTPTPLPRGRDARPAHRAVLRGAADLKTPPARPSR
jgi:hypothetical protein